MALIKTISKLSKATVVSQMQRVNFLKLLWQGVPDLAAGSSDGLAVGLTLSMHMVVKVCSAKSEGQQVFSSSMQNIESYVYVCMNTFYFFSGQFSSNQ